MNKIEVISENKIVSDDDNISASVIDGVLNINIKNNINKHVIFINNLYHNVSFIISDNTDINIVEIKDNKAITKASYKYILGNDSRVVINKFYYMNDYDEAVEARLDGYNASILFNLSVMSYGNQKYNININHNNKKTISNIYNHGVTFGDGTLDMNINGHVKKGMSDSILNQDNKIMIMGNGKSTIRPNLYIDENIVEAKHGASIGSFNEDELFYLEARGIPKKEGYFLLMKGFLLGILKIDDEIKKELENIIEKYGR